MFRKKSPICLAVISILLVSCGGDGGTSSTGPSTRTLSGTVVKGPVSAASVCLFEMNGASQGNQVGNCGTSDASGNFSLPNIRGDGPFMVIATGGTYTDEVSGNAVTLTGSQQALKTIAFPSRSATNIQVTPFTSIIVNEVSRIVSATQTVSVQDVASGQTRVRTAFNLPANLDLLATSPVFGVNENTYGLALRTISQMIADGRSLASIVGTSDATTLSSDYSSANAKVQQGGGANNGGSGSGGSDSGGNTGGTNQPASPVASGSMTVASTTTTRPMFVPAAGGFTIKATNSSPNIELTFDNGSINSPRAVTFLETVAQGTTVSLLEGRDVFDCRQSCNLTKSVAEGAQSPISFTLEMAPMTPRNNTITERITLSGSLTGSVANAWFTLADIPLTTAGSLQVTREDVTQRLTIPVAVVAQSDNTASRQITIFLSNGETVSVNVPATGAPNGSYNAGGFDFCTSNCNITFTSGAETDEVVFSNSNLGRFVVNGTVSVRRTTGSLATGHATSSLQQFSAVSSEIAASNDFRTIRFSRPFETADGLYSVVVEHRNRVVLSAGVGGILGGQSVSYQCNASSPNAATQPLCDGIVIGEDQRSVSFQNVSFRDINARANSNPNPTISVNGTLTARGR